MIIQGNTTEREDGSIVCIGYGLDSNNNVTGKFALPEGHNWICPPATDTVKYVDSMEDLPEIHPDYIDP